MRSIVSTGAISVLFSTAAMAAATPVPISCPWIAGDRFVSGGGSCGGSYYGQGAHVGQASNFAVDCNLYLTGPNCAPDEGYPIVAIADGPVTSAGFNSQGYGYMVKQTIGTVDDKAVEVIYAHFVSAPVVKKGENVKRGQIIGFVGNTGASEGSHLHLEERWGGVSVEMTPIDNMSMAAGAIMLSQNTGVFDREAAVHGSVLGSKYPDQNAHGIHWWHNTRVGYREGNLANDCYAQNWNGSAYGISAIVYDALGGARKAYLVRTGFYHDGAGQGWEERGGPTSDLGMPLGNEYATSYGARQDFQKGFLKFENNAVSVHTSGYTAPGWTSTGWNNQFSYLMAMAYDRNGRAPTVGTAMGATASYSFTAPGATSTYYRQQFEGGSNGDGAIFYQPDNAARNAQATNEAYYVYGNFWTKWNALGGANTCGVPTRDWYLSRDPENWANPTEYKVQNFIRANGEQHYMLERNGVVEWHSSYNCDWITQSPFVVDLAPGQTATFSVTYQNKGTTTWLGAGTPPSNPDYIELRACSAWPDGDEQASWVYPGSGWISSSRVVTATQASIAPEANATFSFTVKVPVNQPLGGDQRAYFRPWHATGGLIENWGGFYVSINVVEPLPTADYTPLVGQFTSDGVTDIGLFESVEGRWFVAKGHSSSFTQVDGPGAFRSWLDDWGAGAFVPLAGDFDGDGLTDVCAYRPQYGRWYVALNDGDRFTQSNGPYTESSWLTDWGTGSGWIPFVGRFDNDDRDDVGVYQSSTGRWFIALNETDRFTQRNGPYAANSWLTDWGTGSGYVPLVGHFNTDGLADIGLYQATNGRWFVALHQGDNSFAQSNGPDALNSWYTDWGTGSGYTPLIGDFNNDGKSDIGLYEAVNGRWFVATNQTDRFRQVNGPAAYQSWLTDWGSGSGYVPLVGNFSSGPSHIGLFQPSLGRWFVAFNQGNSSFAQSDGPYTLNAWYDDWGKEGGSSMLYEPPLEEDSDPPSPPDVLQLIGPNPVNGTAQLTVELPTAGPVLLEVYGVTGRRVATLIHGNRAAGSWGASWNPMDHPSGIYFLRLRHGRTETTKRIVIVR